MIFVSNTIQYNRVVTPEQGILFGFPTPEQDDKFKMLVAHTSLIKVESLPPPPPPRNDPYSEDPELLVFGFLGVIFGLNCSPFLLGASLNHHIRKYELEDPTSFLRALLESLYVDDMISGDNEVKSAFEL